MSSHAHHPYPGEILREEFLPDLGITPYRLAKETGISITHVHGILRGERPITLAVAYRLSAFLGTKPEMWLRIQLDYDLRTGCTPELCAALARIRLHPKAVQALNTPIPLEGSPDAHSELIPPLAVAA